MPYNFHRTLPSTPSAKQLMARQKKQVASGIIKDRMKYASR